MRRKHNIMQNVEKIDEILDLMKSVRVIENCKEWDWEKRYPDFETAINALIKQLKVQRELLLISLIWQKRFLLKQQTLTNSKN
tara:strand:- start:910 stop:1158 length:249 start_codon:yes stop_codon:yes gene_type:complete